MKESNMYEIKNHFDGSVIYRSESANNLTDAVEQYLFSFNGKRANLRGANLRGVNLYNVNLYNADLRDANLVNAGLCGTYLYNADLQGADLRGADLKGANLRGARLGGAILPWDSHDLIAEILRQKSEADLDKLKLAGLVLLQRQWCWGSFCSLDEPQEIVYWAMSTLSEWAWEEDSHVPSPVLSWMLDNNVPRPCFKK